MLMAYQKLGLWFSALSISVEKVTRRHLKKCENCNRLPLGVRMVLKQGSGRSVATCVLCAKCAVELTKTIGTECLRATNFIRKLCNANSIRTPKHLRQWPFDKLLAERSKREKEKKKRERSEAENYDPLEVAVIDPADLSDY
jgi:hypothetical protein